MTPPIPKELETKMDGQAEDEGISDQYGRGAWKSGYALGVLDTIALVRPTIEFFGDKANYEKRFITVMCSTTKVEERGLIKSRDLLKKLDGE